VGDRTFQFDANGNQAGWTHDRNGTRRTIVWDEENRVQSVSDNGHTETYKYDATGDRVIKRGPQGETAYVNPFFTMRNREVGTKHVYVGASRLASKLLKQDRPGSPPNGNQPFEKDTYFYHPDHLGSSNYVTDTDGELYEHLEYFPFGESWIEESSNTQRTPYLFTSKELDEETGLYYVGMRYYDPRASSWLSPDPILAAYMSGKPNGGVFSPQNLGLYGYVWNNPVVLRDSDGAFPVRGYPWSPVNLATHQRITRLAIGREMSLVALRRVVQANVAVDDDQGTKNMSQAKHAMRNENTAASRAKFYWQALVSIELQAAKAAILDGRIDDARDAFGRATHTIQDSRATAHTSAEGEPQIWLGLWHWLAAKWHIDVDMAERTEGRRAKSAIEETRKAFEQLRKDVLGDKPSEQQIRNWNKFIGRERKK
jgi:RHS repeat-associated protein